jgi:dipeptidase
MMTSINSFKNFLSIFLLLFAASVSLNAQQTKENPFNCFSVLAGKNATSDGSVMFAHNEDDWGDRIVNFYKVPQVPRKKSEMITMETGAKLEQAAQTWSYLWLEIPEMSFSDSYMNEWGVTIASDACSSREEEGELSDGGIGYWLRRTMAERSKSAREAVKIGGALVTQFGYASSGRTYCIADPNEAWMLSVVKGKHWVAQRIPDDEVAIIPNYYTITTIDLKDTLNYYGSADLIDYAVKKKWYNPKKMAEFNFRQVYSSQDNLKNMGNIVRHWSAVNLLSEKQYTVDESFPFSFKPKQKVTLNHLFYVLRNHNESSEYDGSENYTKGNPHGQDWSICSSTTQYGFVAQLRSELPVAVGAVLWLAPFRPCVHAFTPWYFGMTEMPEGFARGNYTTALATHFDKIENINKAAPGHSFLKFVEYAKKLDEDYGKQIETIKKNISIFETELFQNQKGFEKKASELNKLDPNRAKRSITEYSIRQVNRSLEMIYLK